MEKERLQILTAGWLSHFPGDFAEELLSVGSFVRFKKGETVYNIEDDQSSLYCLISGSAHFVITMNEQPPRVGHLIGPGCWFGENELLLGKSAILEVTCLLNTELLCVTDSQFNRVADRKPIAWKAIASLSSMNTAVAVGAADDLMIRDARSRLITVLLRFAARRNAFQGQPPMDKLLVTQSDLAVAANLSRSKVARVMSYLADAGALQTIYGGIEILRPEVLEEELSKSE